MSLPMIRGQSEVKILVKYHIFLSENYAGKFIFFLYHVFFRFNKSKFYIHSEFLILYIYNKFKVQISPVKSSRVVYKCTRPYSYVQEKFEDSK